MDSNIINALLLGTVFLTLFLVSEILYRKFHVRVELTRKMVHIASGLLSLSFPVLIQNHWIVFFLCAAFSLVLYVSLRFKFLPSIESVDRVTHGSILFPIVVYLCYLSYVQSGTYTFFYLPILILAISDPMAALVGKRIPLGSYKVFGHSKTLIGSITFFVTAMLCAMFMLSNMNSSALIFTTAIMVALVTTVVEAVTHKGYDNLLIPISCIVTLMLVQ